MIHQKQILVDRLYYQLSSDAFSSNFYQVSYRVCQSFGNSETQVALLITSMQTADTSEGITCWAKKISCGKETQQTCLFVFMTVILQPHHVTKRSETAGRKTFLESKHKANDFSLYVVIWGNREIETWENPALAQHRQVKNCLIYLTRLDLQ